MLHSIHMGSPRDKEITTAQAAILIDCEQAYVRQLAIAGKLLVRRRVGPLVLLSLNSVNAFARKKACRLSRDGRGRPSNAVRAKKRERAPAWAKPDEAGEEGQGDNAASVW